MAQIEGVQRTGHTAVIHARGTISSSDRCPASVAAWLAERLLRFIWRRGPAFPCPGTWSPGYCCHGRWRTCVRAAPHTRLFELEEVQEPMGSADHARDDSQGHRHARTHNQGCWQSRATGRKPVIPYSASLETVRSGCHPPADHNEHPAHLPCFLFPAFASVLCMQSASAAA